MLVDLCHCSGILVYCTYYFFEKNVSLKYYSNWTENCIMEWNDKTLGKKKNNKKDIIRFVFVVGIFRRGYENDLYPRSTRRE